MKSNLRKGVLAFIGMLVAFSASTSANDRIDFNRDVRPILSNHCWNCHGPDEKTRQAGLRLDGREAATAKLESGTTAVVPGNAEASELLRRVLLTDGDEIMPPPAFKRPLTEKQKQTLRQWIDQGAEYAGHWAYQKPQRPALPTVNRADWVRNEIDRFVLARLESEGLSPSLEANKGTWLRRVTLDLTGLPPSVEELDAFLADQTPEAEERVIDRLFQSPRYAERMAMQWLDAARYADTNGYNNDETRSMWPWRDWVIRAFASNMPFDRFLTEQIAGDLLPNATVPQRVATGFSRNHVLTTEGGIIPEEYHIEYVADRVHTTATVFLAMSMQCARCHDHKYDPLTQRDFYSFAAFFNNVPDRVVNYNQTRMAEPLLKVPSPEQEAALAALTARRKELESELAERPKRVDADIAAWEKSLTATQIESSGSPALVARFPLDQLENNETSDSVSGTRKARLVGEAKLVDGKVSKAIDFQGRGHLDAGPFGDFEGDQSFALAAWIKPQSQAAITVLSKMDEANAFRGYDIILEGSKIACHMIHHWPDKGFKVITKDALPLNEWHHIAVVYDGSRQASGVKIFVDGQTKSLEITSNNRLDGTLKTDKPFHIGRRGVSASFQGSIDDVQIFAAALATEDIAKLASGQPLAELKELLAVPTAERTPAQREALRSWYLERIDEPSRKWKAELAELPAKVKAIEDAIPATMVMAESTPRRPSYILRRGQYDQRGEEVPPEVPAALPPLPEGAPHDRRGLAQWFVRPDHPLTARVAVNRWWEMFFGTGLVETTEDFGVQGAYPSHPELLDWLATELIASGWNQRAIMKKIVLSGTYRQSSAVTGRREARGERDAANPDSARQSSLSALSLHERDPHNRLLARGPRYRLSAEVLRDSALFVSGLLKEQIGGPSVKPYQPEGLWEDVSVERRDKYQPDPGDGIYRRSMYTFWKRTCPPPSMSTFDAPDRETCVIRRARTNTPLQALVLLNDPTYVEAARKLAERVLAAGTSDDARLRFAFRSVLTREPTAEETRLIQPLRADAVARFRADPVSAEKLLTVGRSPRNPEVDAAELASWATVCSVLMNLSESISKP